LVFVSKGPYALLALYCAGIISIAVINKPVIGIYLIAGSIPLMGEHGFQTGLFTISTINVLIIITGCALLGGKIFRSESVIDKIPTTILVLILLVISGDIISSLFAQSLHSLRFLSTRCGEFLVFLLIILTVTTFKEIKGIIYILFIAILLSAILGIIGGFRSELLPDIGYISSPRNIWGSPFSFHRSAGLVINWGIYGCFLVTGIVITTTSIFKYNLLKSHKAISALMLALFLLAVIISQTRATYISVSVALLIVFSFSLRHGWMKYVACGVICILLYSFFSTGLGEQILYQAEAMGSLAVEKRLASFSYAFETFLKHPIFGIGYYNFNNMLVDYYSSRGLVLAKTEFLHNQFLYHLVSGGLISFTPYLLLIITILRSVKNVFVSSQDSEMRYLALAILAILSGFFVELSLVPGSGFKIGWLILGLGYCCYLLSGQSVQSTENH